MADSGIDHKKEINGVLYLATAVILGLAFYMPAGRSGWIGAVLAAGGRGLIGVTALALPVIFTYMAIDYLIEQQLRITRLRFTSVLLLLLGTAALLHLLTVDQTAYRQLCLGEDQQPEAWKALASLWRTGIEPELLATGGKPLTGGLLGGLLAQALLAIAGSVGSLVLVGALLLSQIILLLNVSLSRAVGRTAEALQHTRQRVDDAVRSSVATIRENRSAEAKEARSFDLLLPTDQKADTKTGTETGTAAGSPDAETSPDQIGQLATPARTHPSLLDNLKRLWLGAADEPDESAAADLSVPEFLQTAPGHERPDAGKAKAAQPPRSPYDLKLKDPDWMPAPDDRPVQPAALSYSIVSAHSDYEPAASGVDPAAVAPSAPLPADIRRIGQSDEAGTRGNSSSEAGTPAAAAAVQAPTSLAEAEMAAADGRSHWADRTDEHHAAGTAIDLMQTRQSRISGPPGSQMALDLPYQAPPLDLLREDQNFASRIANNSAIQTLGKKLEHTLESFGIQATVIHVTTGPTITRFELSPGPGVKVSRIVSLSDDIALNLAAMGVRIEAPIPGKSAIGIEIPNKETSPVLLRGLLESPEFLRGNSPLTAALGRDIQGSPILCDLAKMPHLLIAGATGSGKSVCINAILMSILYRSSPDDVRMLMIDPKVVELSVYNGIPHLMAPVVTDPKKAANTLLWAVNEMVRRYGLFAEKSVRDINSYNAAALRGEEDFEKLPLILLVIDELSDLMATTPTEVEDAIARLTAMARAAGIHLIIAPQRPSVDVLTGVIKANIPSRIAFAVASQVDSRTILDMAGAEKLLGKGDMLYYPQSSAKPIRGQGAFVTDSEVERVLTHIKTQREVTYDQAIADAIMTAPAGSGKERDSGDQDELLPQALGIVVEAGYASVSLLQRRMNVGYPRAARLIDRMQEMGYVGPFEGSKPRKVLISQAQYLEFKAREDS